MCSKCVMIGKNKHQFKGYFVTLLDKDFYAIIKEKLETNKV